MSFWLIIFNKLKEETLKNNRKSTQPKKERRKKKQKKGLYCDNIMVFFFHDVKSLLAEV
jgi:hypothetical protein